MKVFEHLFAWYGKKAVLSVLVVIVVLAVIGIATVAMKSGSSAEEVVQLPTVQTDLAGSLGGDASIRLIGTVKARSQAEIESETAGRVVSVNVALGDTVTAGQIIAQLENASERAAVLQAEGAYEAALAIAAQSDVGVSEAENALLSAKDTAVSAYRSAFTTFRTILLNDVDDIFTDPEAKLPGVRLDTFGYTNYLNTERVRFQNVLTDWQTNSLQVTTQSNLSTLLNDATTEISALIEMVDIILTAANRDSSNGTFNKSDLELLSVTLSQDRATLNSVLSALDNARRTLSSAEEALNRARIGGTTADLSAANAQVKQALGSLRAAQANLAKTILRTPIAGTVNTLRVDVGDFIGSFEQVAIVANNNGLEITTYVGESDRDALELGEEVRINNTVTGTITHIAPAVDPVTRKIEVRIATEDTSIANGDTVSISLTESNGDTTSAQLFIPITAVKFTETNGAVFTVENNTLVSHPVTIGTIRGSFVEILSGIEATTEIVVDARGRAAGQKVEAISL